MITIEKINKMDIVELHGTKRSLWMERRPNMELIDACDKRTDELNKEAAKRKAAMIEYSEIVPGEIQ